MDSIHFSDSKTRKKIQDTNANKRKTKHVFSHTLTNGHTNSRMTIASTRSTDDGKGQIRRSIGSGQDRTISGEDTHLKTGRQREGTITRWADRVVVAQDTKHTERAARHTHTAAVGGKQGSAAAVAEVDRSAGQTVAPPEKMR